MVRACSTNGGEEKCKYFLVEKSEGKILLGRLRYRWANNIKMDLTEAVWGGMDWTDLSG
jgi:hypothetical protein